MTKTPEDYQFEEGKRMDRGWRNRQRIERIISLAESKFQRIWCRIYHRDKSPWKKQ